MNSRPIATIEPQAGSGGGPPAQRKLIFDSLVGVDQAGQEFSKEIGNASDWQVSDDGLTYRFQLRQGVMFHNGDEVTAEDVKFTLERLGDPEASCSSCSQIAGNLDAVTVIGPYEVEAKLHHSCRFQREANLTLQEGLRDIDGSSGGRDRTDSTGGPNP